MSDLTDVEFQRVLSNEIWYAYQPVVDLDSSEVVYSEALLRWAHPTRGLMDPSTYLRNVTSKSRADLLTVHGLDQLLADLARLQQLYGPRSGVGLNLSAVQLAAADDTVDLIGAALERRSVDPALLRIEVVEDLNVASLPLVQEPLRRLQAMGVKVLLDDFGTGASSLSTLTDLNFDGIKIDRHFVSAVLGHRAARSVIEALVSFGRSTNVEVIAEGVEDDFVLHGLRRLGCSIAQGYLLCRPSPLADLEPLVDTRIASPSVPRSSASVSPPGLFDELTERIDALRPRSSTQNFEDIVTQFDEIDGALMQLAEREANELRVRLAQQMTLAAAYAGSGKDVLHWGFHASNLAEEFGYPGITAQVLAIIATVPHDTESGRHVAIEAFSRALQIRSTETLKPEELSNLDNALGASLTLLGMNQRASEWWDETLKRSFDSDYVGDAMAALNLVNHELARVENGEQAVDEVSLDEAFERVERGLAKLAASAFTPSGVFESMQARYAVARGDIDAAIELFGDWADGSINKLGRTAVLRAQAVIARAVGDTDAFVRTTEELWQAEASRNELESETLYVEALVQAGRYQEAAELQRIRWSRATAEYELRCAGLFDWLRTSVEFDLRYGEITDLHNAAYRPTASDSKS